jgi:hypothetical protein
MHPSSRIRLDVPRIKTFSLYSRKQVSQTATRVLAKEHSTFFASVGLNNKTRIEECCFCTTKYCIFTPIDES